MRASRGPSSGSSSPVMRREHVARLHEQALDDGVGDGGEARPPGDRLALGEAEIRATGNLHPVDAHGSRGDRDGSRRHRGGGFLHRRSIRLRAARRLVGEHGGQARLDRARRDDLDGDLREPRRLPGGKNDVLVVGQHDHLRRVSSRSPRGAPPWTGSSSRPRRRLRWRPCSRTGADCPRLRRPPPPPSSVARAGPSGSRGDPHAGPTGRACSRSRRARARRSPCRPAGRHPGRRCGRGP